MAANIGAELQSLPLEQMLAAPLNGAIKAQAMAAHTTVDFIQQVGMVPNDAKDRTKGQKVVNVDFSYTKPVYDKRGQLQPEVHNLSVPLLSIVPVPYIRVQELNVDFEFRITDTSTVRYSNTYDTKTEKQDEVTTETNFEGDWWFASVDEHVKTRTTTDFTVTTCSKYDSENKTDRSARLTVQMKATQDQIPEGLARVLTLLNDSITAAPPKNDQNNPPPTPPHLQ